MGTPPYADPTNSGQWAKDLLTALGDPLSATNVGYLEAWIPRESASGFGYNPLGTEQTTPTSIHAPGNSASVQAFQSWADGLAATVKTFTGNPGNAALEKDLASGDATLGELSAAQQQGSWSTGGESSIAALGTSHPFTYGGAYGLVPGAKGVASGGLIPGIGPFGLPAPAPTPAQAQTLAGYKAGLAQASDWNPVPGLASSIFGPFAHWIEEGAADVTFVVFGLVLVVIGLVVAFKSEGESAADAGAKVAAVAA